MRSYSWHRIEKCARILCRSRAVVPTYHVHALILLICNGLSLRKYAVFILLSPLPSPSVTWTEAGNSLKASVTLRNAPSLHLTRCSSGVVWSADQNPWFYFKVATDWTNLWHGKCAAVTWPSNRHDHRSMLPLPSRALVVMAPATGFQQLFARTVQT